MTCAHLVIMGPTKDKARVKLDKGAIYMPISINICRGCIENTKNKEQSHVVSQVDSASSTSSACSSSDLKKQRERVKQGRVTKKDVKKKLKTKYILKRRKQEELAVKDVLPKSESCPILPENERDTSNQESVDTESSASLLVHTGLQPVQESQVHCVDPSKENCFQPVTEPQSGGQDKPTAHDKASGLRGFVKNYQICRVS
ncbi:uncharacterized protein LOC106076132 [Biomphalaria glabrata]|uniref:Uncharacterized protein LOC106076132 n=1 Tax=Biomphalaria glabrata TaxID=6526 RepID=A0A9W3ASE0_BIOGL|nr:uncharacterized protein LOC106076132 [Biomphalaria glabrata]